ncbi:MAG: orotate phosphoribosyltransferase [Peltula sp. TS41687]|nr:MAG: orotate phosphoribosyltransferase [Peltula sp. TS41687]
MTNLNPTSNPTTTTPPPPPPLLPPHKSHFLSTCVQNSILRFGTFTLKSGRVSPYFFNASLFSRADLLHSIASAYAETILSSFFSSSSSSSTSSSSPPSSSSSSLEFDVLFGPAYKGIPLAVATTLRLAELAPQQFSTLSYAFDRKEAKSHGEGGRIVGCQDLKAKRVLLVDDVITAGTAVGQAVEVLRAEGALLVGVVVALDRMESVVVSDEGGEQQQQQQQQGDGVGGQRESAVGRIRRLYGVPCVAVLSLDDIIVELEGRGTVEDGLRLREYRDRYGVGAGE